MKHRNRMTPHTAQSRAFTQLKKGMVPPLLKTSATAGECLLPEFLEKNLFT
jgi:hypothetical protein